jgi:hypothetical protein
MVAMIVINQPVGVVTKLNTIIKICKYKGIHDGHHFIPMAMEEHGTLERDMVHFIKECAHLLLDRQSRGHLSWSFIFSFSCNVLILLFNVL